MTAWLLSGDEQTGNRLKIEPLYPDGAGWADLANSDPISDVFHAIEIFHTEFGQRPETMTTTLRTYHILLRHPLILDRCKFAGIMAPREDQLAAVFDVKNFVVL